MTKIGPRRARALRWARCVLLLSMLVAPPHAIAQPAAPHDPDSILVRFRTSVSAEARALAHTLVGAHAFKSFQIVEGLQAVKIPPGMTVKEALEFYRQQPDVLYAEPNWIVETQGIPNDPRFGELWGLHNTGQNFGTPDADIDAPEAWDITTGSSDVVVAVIDSGIDYNHQDLSANMFRNTVDCNSNGVDDDGNGQVDDCFGIDTANNDSDPFDDLDHGTHVAGTIGAAGNNGVGVVGVNWTVRLMACKFLNAAGSGTTDGAIGCLEYVKLMKDRGVNIVATNNSWGGGPFSQALFDAIEAHLQRGILFIAAAGNGGADQIGDDNDIEPFYPSNYYLPHVISVAATTRTNGRSPFSNFGRRTVHLGAPGSEILSTTPGNTYSTLNGTSMATPHVTGVAALLKAQDPARDWRTIKNLILAGGDAIAALATTTITQKRLNARGALTCSNSTVLSRLLPVSTTISGSIGTPIDLAALHINCANPNGNVSVTVNPGGEVVSLVDDGLDSDQTSGDGIYSGRWTPSAGGTFTITFPAGDVVTVQVLANYSVVSTTFSYRNITGTNLNLSDDTSASITSPFPILFGGGSFTTLFVSSNGHVNFTGSFNDPSNASLPTSLATTLVAPWWDDLFPVVGTSQNVFWVVTGSAPNRELVIEWRDVRHFSCRSDSTATTKFQVVFFEGSSSILFNYADVFFGGTCAFADRGGSATVGVQVGPSLGTQFSFNSLSLNNNTALLWTAPAAAPPTLNVTPTSRDFGNVPVGSSEDRTFTVQNIGGGTLTGNATTSAPFTVVSGGSYALTVGQSQRVTVRFTPTSASRFVGSVSFSGAGTTSRSLKGTGISVSPIAPSGLTATPVSASQINLAWQDNNGNETETRIERKTGAGGTFAQIATVGANITSFSDTGLTPSTTFVYRVRACNAVGCSDFSNEAAASTQAGFTLTVTVRGSASGTVTSNPAGINCGTDCSEVYGSGTMVTLSVSHGADVRFKGWSGACTGTSTCTVTMSAARTVTATFSKIFTDGSGDDGTIPSGGSTTIREIHIAELRLAINRIRAQNDLASFSYTDPSLTPKVTEVRKIHFDELRTALTQAYQQAGQTPPAFTDPTISPRVTLIRAIHLNELRAATHVLD